MSEQTTNCYTYSVNLVVSVFAENEEQAETKVDLEGGFVSSRKIQLISETSIFTPQNEE
jgi:hypothetical protein